jgi:hypothetical protein
MTISLAFLTPDLVKAAVEGRLPRGIGVTRLRDAPAEWSRQYAASVGMRGAAQADSLVIISRRPEFGWDPGNPRELSKG